MNRMDSKNLISGPANLDVVPGQYAAFLIRISGLTAAGAAPTLANFGLIKMMIGGRAAYSVTVAATQEVNSLDLGQVESSIGALGGNPITLSAMLLASRVGDGNIFDVSEQDNCQIECDLSGISAANVASGTITLYGIPQEGVQMYMPQMYTNQPTISASTTQTVQLKYDNIAALYFFGLTNLDTISVEKDGQQVVNADVSALLAASNMDCRIEAAHTSGLRIDLQRSGALSEALCDLVVLQLTAGSGGSATPQIIPLSLDFTPDVLARSQSLVAAKAEAKFSRKIRGGKSRPITVAKALSAQ